MLRASHSRRGPPRTRGAAPTLSTRPTRRARARPGLTRERVLHAALQIVDSEGLDALSMRRLAAELGVQAMSLYSHLADKKALLDGLQEIVLRQMPPAPPKGDW